jgi:hypothetical protein
MTTTPARVSAAFASHLLAALCLGVLLVGIELFITAVALPRIIVDLSGWTDLRRASWIITVYLITYIAATPLAGRAADRYRLPGLMIGALAIFALGSLQGRPRPRADGRTGPCRRERATRLRDRRASHLTGHAARGLVSWGPRSSMAILPRRPRP